MNFTTFNDLAFELSDRLGITSDEAIAAIRANRNLFDGYEQIDEATFDRILRAAWSHANPGAAWPFGEPSASKACPKCAAARCVCCGQSVDCGSYDHSGEYVCDECMDCNCCSPSPGCEAR